MEGARYLTVDQVIEFHAGAFLLLNGYELRMADDEIAELFERLGSNEIGQGEFFDAISTHALPSEPGEGEAS